MTPMELFDQLRQEAVDAVKLTFMEAGKALPDDVLEALLKPVIAVTIGTVSQHYSQHPEHLALAGTAICEVCHEPVQTIQVGVDPARDEASTELVKVAWPCGHLQPTRKP